MNTLQSIAAILAGFAAFFGGLYAVVTRPLQALFKAQMDVLRAEISGDIKAVGVETNSLRQEIKAEMNGLRQEIKAEMNGLRQEIKADLAAMELRLNERIDSRIVRK